MNIFSAKSFQQNILLIKAIALYFLVNVLVSILPALLMSFFSLIQFQSTLYSIVIIIGSGLFATSALSLYLSLKVLSKETLFLKVRYCVMLLLILIVLNYGWEHLKISLNIRIWEIQHADMAQKYEQIIESARNSQVLLSLFKSSLSFIVMIPVVLVLESLEMNYLHKKKTSDIDNHR